MKMFYLHSYMLCFIGTDTLPPKSVSVFSILLESVREGKERDTPTSQKNTSFYNLHIFYND